MEDYSAKNIRQGFRDKGAFYITNELSDYLKSLFPVEDVKEEYIPKFFEKVLEEYWEYEEKEREMEIETSELEKKYFIIPESSVKTKCLNIVNRIDKQKVKIEKRLKEI